MNSLFLCNNWDCSCVWQINYSVTHSVVFISQRKTQFYTLWKHHGESFGLIIFLILASETPAALHSEGDQSFMQLQVTKRQTKNVILNLLPTAVGGCGELLFLIISLKFTAVKPLHYCHYTHL